MEKEIRHTILALQKGGAILYPTDTIWGIGCDATNDNAVAKIYNIKQRENSKSLIILVDSYEMLQSYLEYVPKSAKTIVENSLNPTTIIYGNPKGIAKKCLAEDNSLAIRIVKDDFCKELIRRYGKPIVSTSANLSGKSVPQKFEEIENSILECVDYAVNLHRDKICNKPSTILKVADDGSVTTIRE